MALRDYEDKKAKKEKPKSELEFLNQSHDGKVFAKRVQINVYVSEEQRDKIAFNAKKAGLSISSYMKLRALKED